MLLFIAVVASSFLLLMSHLSPDFDLSLIPFRHASSSTFLSLFTIVFQSFHHLSAGYYIPLEFILLSCTLFAQGRRKHLKLGGARHFEGAFFLRKRGHFLKVKRALLCLLQNLGRHMPPVPPGFYVYVFASS